MGAWYAQQWSSLVISGVVFPVYSDLDIQETVTLRDFGELEANINNRMRHVYGIDPALGDKLDIIWSASRVRRPPAFFGLKRGDIFTAVPILPWCVRIPAGQSQVVLPRDTYPGSVLVEDLGTGEFMPPGYSVAGRTVTLPGAAQADAIVGFRPVLTLMMDGREHSSGEFSALSTTWRVTAKEV